MFNWFKSNASEPSGVDKKSIADHIKDYIAEACSGDSRYYADKKVKETAHGEQLLDHPPEQQVVVLQLVLEAYIKQFKKSKIPAIGVSYSSVDYCAVSALQQLAVQLLRRNLPYKDAELAALLKHANNNWETFSWYRPHNALLGVLERHYPDQVLPEAINTEVRRAINKVEGMMYSTAEDRKFIERARHVIGEGERATLKADFNWSKTIIQEIAALPAADKAHWESLLAHAQTAEASKPSRKWLQTAQQLLDQIGAGSYAENLSRWLALIQQEKSDDLPLRHDLNATIVRGLIWAAALLEPELVAREIKLLAAYCFRKVKDVGAVSAKVGNACLYVLGQLPGTDSVSMLSELLLKIKYPSARRMVEKALDAAAERNNMSREDLMEISVPDYDLNGDGLLQRTFDDVTAIVRIEAEQKVELVWQKPDGKFQKTIPANIKDACPEDIKALKKTVKDIRATLQSQSARIEKCFLKPTAWTYQQWCERYRDHHLLQYLTHKLIWQFELDGQNYSAMYRDGRLLNASGESLAADLGGSQVRLWHPVSANVDEVMAWRNFISDKEITQPFKQAHREVYLLTDAERATEHYSNRFAAHILKQHQLNALCQQRGWQYVLQGAFDSWNAPTIELPQWDLSVEFYVEGVESSENQMGIFNYVSSDQVRFLRDQELVRLDEVAPIAFSEVMRDVDLFIGVCSIGNDPAWHDSGVLATYNDYWRDYSFGELLESAKIRKDVLARLLPKLKIADKCAIDGRFLTVQGDFRTYKIHLGSGNILMEPNDQYLCIVENRSSNSVDTRNLVLPFEGDHRMAVILSKAFLLAADKKITDKTILSQIKRNS